MTWFKYNTMYEYNSDKYNILVLGNKAEQVSSVDSNRRTQNMGN